MMKASATIPRTSQRLWARLVDQVLRFGLESPFWFQIFRGVFFEEGTVRIHLVWVVYFVLVRLSYEGLSYYFFRSTLGKYLFNLRVVNRDHPDAPLELTQCYFRALVSELSFFGGWALYGTLFFRYDRSHWIDLWARTRVVSIAESGNSFHRRPQIRWILGGLFVLFSLFSGLERAGSALASLSYRDNYLEIELQG
ncbi:MAG: RDD family protein [Bdellovibrionaceae bacterium]|nr:RDD family protein [Pseudobdellovibrionaceae bacterium]